MFSFCLHFSFFVILAQLIEQGGLGESMNPIQTDLVKCKRLARAIYSRVGTTRACTQLWLVKRSHTTQGRACHAAFAGARRVFWVSTREP